MTGRTRIKICGITDLHQAREIVAMGVDGLGFIFVKESPRYIDPEEAREIIRNIPPFVDAVGVFMNEDPDLVNDIAQYCDLTMAQLHGSEPPDYCKTISCRVLKAIRVRPETSSSVFAPYFGVVKGFLLDTYRQGQGGGTGETFDWHLVEGLELPGPVVLAGGISPDNVSAAIDIAKPFAVDVNSGVESAPGRKDLAKVQQLVREVWKK